MVRENVGIQKSSLEEKEKVIQTITLGFVGDPIARWIWPDATTYLETMPRFTEAFGGRGFNHDTVYSSACGNAAAMWLPPGIEPDGDAIDGIMAETIAEERMEDIGSLFEQMDEQHPHEECWYLPLIAADPGFTGRGLGGALMRHALQRCDDEGLIAYLESSNPRNISLYERLGFETIGCIQAGDSPVMTPMVRAPH